MRINRRLGATVALLAGLYVVGAGCANEPESAIQGPPVEGGAAQPDVAPKEDEASPTGVPRLKNPPAAPTIGKLKTIKGETVTLEALRGKVVILDFWATWCGPCRMTIPLLKEMHKEYGEEGLVVLGISDETVKQVEPFAKAMDMNYTVVADPATSSTWQVNYQVRSLPTMAVVDRKGKVRLMEAGLDMRQGMGTRDRLNELIPQLLAEK